MNEEISVERNTDKKDRTKEKDVKNVNNTDSNHKKIIGTTKHDKLFSLPVFIKCCVDVSDNTAVSEQDNE
jgi:hypothetical protein